MARFKCTDRKTGAVVKAGYTCCSNTARRDTIRASAATTKEVKVKIEKNSSERGEDEDFCVFQHDSKPESFPFPKPGQEVIVINESNQEKSVTSAKKMTDITLTQMFPSDTVRFCILKFLIPI